MGRGFSPSSCFKQMKTSSKTMRMKEQFTEKVTLFVSSATPAVAIVWKVACRSSRVELHFNYLKVVWRSVCLDSLTVFTLGSELQVVPFGFLITLSDGLIMARQTKELFR